MLIWLIIRILSVNKVSLQKEHAVGDIMVSKRKEVSTRSPSLQ